MSCRFINSIKSLRIRCQITPIIQLKVDSKYFEMRFAQIAALVAASVALASNFPGGLQSYLSTELRLEDELWRLTDYVVDKKYSLLQLHRKLVSSPSVSLNELSVSKWLLGYLQDAGLTVELQQVLDDPKNYNVYAYLGKSRNTSLLLTSHMDTVPPFIPYSVNGTEIRGRGACDAKGSVATQIIAYLDLVNQGKLKEGDVAMLFVVGEETKGFGMRKVSESLGAYWDAAIFGEPTENKLGIGHKGIVAFEVVVQGKASHSGYPELGISATEILIPILDKLQKLELPKSDLLGASTLNVGTIEAGVAFNVVPALAKASIAIRVASDVQKTIESVREVIEDADNVSIPIFFSSEPQYLDYEVPGFDTITLAYTTDIPNLTTHLQKKYLYGPGTIHVAHGDNEFVENQDLLDAVDGYKRLVEHVLSQN